MTMRTAEAEQAVLGSIIIDSRCLEAVTRTLCVQDFALEINRELYQAILRLDRSGRKIDPVTVLEEAAPDDMNVRSYVRDLMDITPTAANVEEYVKIVREKSLVRGAISVSEYISSELGNHTPVEEVLMGAARQIEALQKEGVNEDLLDPDSAMLAFYEHRDLVNQGGDAAYVRTGYQDLDKQLGGGMLNSGMYILAARPGMGKTTLAINIADRIAKNGKPVLFVSLEMDTNQIEAKRLARETGIPSDRLLMDALTDEEETSIGNATEMIRSLPVYLNKRDTVTVSQVEVMARRVKGLRLIVIDYIGKILPELLGRSPGRVEYMTEISGDIKNLARRFNVPVLVLCQLNRAPSTRSDPQPILTDLRDTGAIEQDADGVIFLYRPDYDKPRASKKETKIDIQVIVSKNRHGPVGDCTMAFDLSSSKLTTTRYRSIAKRENKKQKSDQMTWEELQEKWDSESVFEGKEATS